MKKRSTDSGHIGKIMHLIQDQILLSLPVPNVHRLVGDQTLRDAQTKVLPGRKVENSLLYVFLQSLKIFL